MTKTIQVTVMVEIEADPNCEDEVREATAEALQDVINDVDFNYRIENIEE